MLSRISVDDLHHLARLRPRPPGNQPSRVARPSSAWSPSKGDEILESLSARVELSRVAEVLRMYCKALTGTNVAIHSADALAEKNIGWVTSERPSTEGTAIYLPASVEEYVGQGGELRRLQGVLHPPGRPPGVRQLRLPLPAARATSSPTSASHWKTERGGPKKPLTDIERFFDLFDDRRLVADLFAVAEDARVDRLVAREYGGIRSIYRRVQDSRAGQAAASRRICPCARPSWRTWSWPAWTAWSACAGPRP